MKYELTTETMTTDDGVFSARLYGARSHKNRKLLEGVKQAVEASQC